MIRFVLLLVAVLLALDADAQTPRARGACANSTIAIATVNNGMDLQASPSGNGIYINHVAVNAAASAYAMRTGTSATLTANLTTITPLFTFGQGAVTAIFREGTAPAALAEGAYLFVDPFIGIAEDIGPVFIPPGSFLTVLRQAVTTASNITICFTEAP